MISGRYVKTFAEATHALPQGLHLNADYPFKVPKCRVIGRMLELTPDGGGEPVTLLIRHGKRGQFVKHAQKSTFENVFGRKATEFRFLPFRDERTSVPGLVQLALDDLMGNPGNRPTDRP